MTRYSRQTILPEVGAEGQERLAASRVLVVGAGGLGATLLPLLAGAGVGLAHAKGEIRIFDPDRVEEHNLHRQILYRQADLARPKAQVAAEALKALNPEVAIRAECRAMDPVVAGEAVLQGDVVIDAADNFAVSYALSDACHLAQVPLVSASVLGRQGYVGAFCGTAPSLRALFPDLPGQAQTCATGGVMGPVVAMLGAMQAQMVLSLLLGQDGVSSAGALSGSQPLGSSPVGARDLGARMAGPSLAGALPAGALTTGSPRAGPTPMGQATGGASPLGRVMSVDLATWRVTTMSFAGAPEPARIPAVIAEAQVDPADLLIDLTGADRPPQDQTPKDGQRVVFKCVTGLRAWRAARHLVESGHQNVAICTGAVPGYQNEGHQGTGHQRAGRQGAGARSIGTEIPKDPRRGHPTTGGLAFGTPDAPARAHGGPVRGSPVAGDVSPGDPAPVAQAKEGRVPRAKDAATSAIGPEETAPKVLDPNVLWNKTPKARE